MRSISSRARHALRVAVSFIAVTCAGGALAQESPGAPPGSAGTRSARSAAPAPLALAPSPADGRGPLALLLHLGPYSGFGAGVAVGTRDVGVRASVGWTPLLTVLTSGAGSDLQLYGALQISPDLYARVLSPRPTTHLGVQGGYRYSTLLGHGAAVGGYAQFALGGAVDALVSVGLLAYPEGADRLKRDQHLPSGTTFSFPGPSVNLGVSLGLAFFP